MTVSASPTKAAPPAGFSTLNKSGLVIAGVLGVMDFASAFSPTPEGEVGPPRGILVLGGVLGVITVVGVVWAFRTLSRSAGRVVAASRVVSAITALPAFFVDVPAWLKLLAGAIILVTFASVVMILTPARRSLGAVRGTR